MQQKSFKRQARILALESIYQFFLDNEKEDFQEILINYKTKNNKPYFNYLKKITNGTIENLKIIDQKIEPFATRSLKSMDITDLSLLRLGVFELVYLEVPYKVVLNEYIEIAKDYGAESSYKFINSILDKISQEKA